MFGKAILSQNNGFSGKIDDVRIYDRVLSAVEIQQLAGSTGSTALLSTVQQATATSPPPTESLSTPVEMSVVPDVVGQANDDRDVDDDLIVAVVPTPAVDLILEPSAAGSYIPEPQPISVGSRATLYRAATGEYDLQPLGDDPVTDGEDDLLVDILAESPLAVPL
jgi:hypothetical protein